MFMISQVDRRASPTHKLGKTSKTPDYIDEMFNCLGLALQSGPQNTNHQVVLRFPWILGSAFPVKEHRQNSFCVLGYLSCVTHEKASCGAKLLVSSKFSGVPANPWSFAIDLPSLPSVFIHPDKAQCEFFQSILLKGNLNM